MAKNATAPAKNAALTRFMQQHEKKYGRPIHLGDGGAFVGYDVIPTGSMMLDLKLGIGGWPKGRLSQIYGNPSVGKSLVLLRSLAEAQRKEPGRYVGWLDIENSWTDDWARQHGVDPSRVLLIQANDIESAEEQFQALYDMIKTGLISIVGLDSLGQMITAEEIGKDADEVVVGTMAKLITKMIKKILGKLPEANCAFVAVNQVRDIIGPRGGKTASGPNAWKHGCAIDVYLRDAGNPLNIKESDGRDMKERPVGKDVAFKIEKSKVSSPGGSGLITLVHKASAKHGPVGINKASEAFLVGKLTGAIEMGGGGYGTLPCGERLRGEDAIKAYLGEHPEEIEAVRTRALALVDNVVDDYPELHTQAGDEVTPEQAVNLDEVSVEEAV